MARRSKVKAAVEAESDPSAWILENDLAQFLLMHTTEIKYMCMFGKCCSFVCFCGKDGFLIIYIYIVSNSFHLFLSYHTIYTTTNQFFNFKFLQINILLDTTKPKT